MGGGGVEREWGGGGKEIKMGRRWCRSDNVEGGRNGDREGEDVGKGGGGERGEKMEIGRGICEKRGRGRRWGRKGDKEGSDIGEERRGRRR